ncbi:MAG: hypothetical protein H6818_02425 [Phycisphaerales bacterium]|nr:hypothetical protein [Phycisphaerales bacterium]MCB9863170.1 hypothetical protein [Phycisphaerales bacterium]
MKKPLYYTFGNHMHWVDMQWLWGYDVLPGCVDDMLALIEKTGAKGNVNFDAVGYEKMAAECPVALGRLSQAIAHGDVEPVGCSYGQPYGLFHGGESNIRQFTYGVRATVRLLGVRPATFWEEEFYFFDQLPQILRGSGFSGACLFFQWTWHTPELPRESASLIHWQGIDGSELPTLPRNSLNVHQWPEDFDGLLTQGLVRELDFPVVAQWLELMPSRDWMCRSEVLLPRLVELMSDDRFDVRPRSAGRLIAELCEQHAGPVHTPIESRQYHPDDVWHGMTLGKNADRHPRTSRVTEQLILAAESTSALASLLGRPYPSWDVYPTWELDEAWRELLAAQHHDNHECEGLCGFVGYHQMAKAQLLASEVIGRVQAQIGARSGGPVSINPLGWTRRIERFTPQSDGSMKSEMVEIPPFGYVRSGCKTEAVTDSVVTRQGPVCTLSRDGLEVDVNTESARILQIRSISHPDGVLNAELPLLDLYMRSEGQHWLLPGVANEWIGPHGELHMGIAARETPNDSNGPGFGHYGGKATITIRIPPGGIGVDVSINDIQRLPRPDAGLQAALRMPIATARPIASIRADSPYAIREVRGSGRVSRKYPTGDWMTSPQWFEHLEGSIISHRLIDLLSDDGRGLLVLHDGSQQWFRTPRGVDAVLNAYDPWDEKRYDPTSPNGWVCFRFVPHDGLSDVKRATLAAEFAVHSAFGGVDCVPPSHQGACQPVGGGGDPVDHAIPHTFAPFEVGGDPNILCHAFYRESMKSGEHLPAWAGYEMAHHSDGACTHPFVVRLVEWNGIPGEVVLSLPGEIVSAAKTNLMGETGPDVGGGSDTEWLVPESADPPEWAKGLQVPGGWHRIRVRLRAREIATVMLDLTLGRKQWRDLDAKRSVWATVHRVEKAGSP